MNTAEIFVKYFDFRKPKEQCNFFNCEARYDKEIIFHEIDIKIGKGRELAKIRVCEKHLEKIREILKVLNKESIKERKVIKAKISQG